MAQNNPKRNPQPAQNPGSNSLSRLRQIRNLVKSRRFKVGIGICLLFFSFYLLVSMVSWFVFEQADQSEVIRFWDGNFRDRMEGVQNSSGFWGAWLSNLFVFDLFGISSFLVPPLIFLVSVKILFKKELVPLRRAGNFALFAGLWISTLLGYIVFISASENSLGFLAGICGYELGTLLNDWFGWGTVLFMFISLLLFYMFFFNDDLAFIFNRNSQDLSKPKTEPLKPSVPASEADDAEDSESVSEELNRATPKESGLNKKKVKVPLFETNFKLPFINGSSETATDNEPNNNSDGKTDSELLPEPEKNVEELIVIPLPEEPKATKQDNYDPTLDLASYQYPTLDLLQQHSDDLVTITHDELLKNKDRIVETLSNYGIGIASIKETVGPTVTLYEIVPDAGVRIARIKNLEDDIALSLAALGIRIIAPIPGKGTIGIEVPNKNRKIVGMRSVLGIEKFMKSDKDLPIVLGKTISNEVYVADLAKMPHLLMAGATGQGKSVGLNVLLTSLIYKKHPSQLKLVLVDPKKVELSIYSTIERHFLAKLPDTSDAIITDTRKVIHTLNSLCNEMDMRYDLLKEAGCRNLKEYNLKFVERRLNPEKGHRFMPYIVLIIDELADLMMTAGKEVETPIARLAQLARAIGIHLVVATQRPSVNVITGIIKANFPARLSFKVTSKVDSRTILDTGGAQQLVGQGDMLLSLGSEVIRLQCPFVDTSEVEDICAFIGNQRGYESAYLLPEYEGDETGTEKSEIDIGGLDPMFSEAARLIVIHQQGSTSLIQRKLKLGYNRSGRIMDQMEAFGIVGANEGTKAREVLIMDEQSLEMRLKEIGI